MRQFAGLPGRTEIAVAASSFVVTSVWITVRAPGFSGPASFRSVLYSDGMLFVVGVFCLWSFSRLVAAPGRRGAVARVAIVLAFVSLGAGLVLGRVSGFSGEILLTEGQHFGGNARQYVPGTVRKGSKREKPPQLAIMLWKVNALDLEDGNTPRATSAELGFLEPGRDSPPREVTLSRWPKVVGENLVWLIRTGYAPYYRFWSPDGSLVDEAFVALEMVPAGQEDFFRLLLPHTFSLRYTPTAAVPGAFPGREGAADHAGNGGRYRVRISRNKELVTEREVRPGEPVEFDGARISFDAPRYWAKFLVVHDRGLWFIAIAGVLFLIVIGASVVSRARGFR